MPRWSCESDDLYRRILENSRGSAEEHSQSLVLKHEKTSAAEEEEERASVINADFLRGASAPSPPPTSDRAAMFNTHPGASSPRAAKNLVSKVTLIKKPNTLSPYAVRDIERQKLHRFRVLSAQKVTDTLISRKTAEKWKRMRTKNSTKTERPSTMTCR